MEQQAKQTARENLAIWRESAANNRELCLLQAYELGKAYGRAAGGNLFQDRAALMLPQPEPRAQKPGLPHTFDTKSSTVEEQMAFCRGLLEIAPNCLQEEAPLLLLPPPASPKVAFLDSYFAREALRRFEEVLSHPRPLTAPSFATVCEQLAADEADFAILPLEDSAEGRFLRLQEEIDRFEFRITHVCDIPYRDENRSVTMALLAKRYRPHVEEAGVRRWSCRLFADENPREPIDFLNAACAADLVLHSLGSTSAPYGAHGMFYTAVFESSPQAEHLFEAYLTICHPRARALGHYYHLKQESMK